MTTTPAAVGIKCDDGVETSMSGTLTFGDLLQGYAIAQLMPMMPDGQGGYEKAKPFGDTGLSPRIAQIVYLWEASATFRRRRFLPASGWPK